MRDRIYINISHRQFLNDIKANNTLGFNLPNAKDVFLLAVALGLNSPKDIVGKKDGYFLLKDVRTADKALFASITLGKVTDDKEIDQYAKDEVNYDEAERCAESGFAILKSKIDEAGGNEELLTKRLISELDLLYQKNVKSL